MLVDVNKNSQLSKTERKMVEKIQCEHQRVCVSLAGVWGLKEDPHLSVNNKARTRCLAHICMNANAHKCARGTQENCAENAGVVMRVDGWFRCGSICNERESCDGRDRK